jgi:hypothetical protein
MQSRLDGGLPAKLSQGPRTGYDLSRVAAGISRGANQKKKLEAAPWSQTWPAPGATLDLDFENNRGFVRGLGQGGVMDGITYTRASSGWYVGEDGLLKEAVAGEPRFDWGGVEQLLGNSLRSTENPENWVFNGTRFNFTGPDADGFFELTNLIDTAVATNFSELYTFGTSGIPNAVIVKSVEVREGVGATHIRFGTASANRTIFVRLSDGEVVLAGTGVVKTEVYPLPSGGWRIEMWIDANSTASGLQNEFGFGVWNGSNGFVAGNTGHTCLVRRPSTTLVRNNPDFRDSVPYVAVGAQPTTNTPLRPTPTSNGLLIEEARTNRLLWCRDATQTEWVKTDITAAKDQTGIDGEANAASSLTATADGGTCIQTITLASGARTGSVYLKRLTGTGIVQVSLDGTTWSTADLSTDEWRRIVLSGTVTNPVVGIRLATSGDAVAMDFGQVEDEGFATSPVLTEGATATRAVDDVPMTTALVPGWYLGSGTFQIDAELRCFGFGGTAAPRHIFGLASSINNDTFTYFFGLETRRLFTSPTLNEIGQDYSTRKYNAAVGFNAQSFIVNAALDGVTRTTNTRMPNLSTSTSHNQLGQVRIFGLSRVAIGVTQITGTIKRLIYVPKETSQAGLQTLTAP